MSKRYSFSKLSLADSCLKLFHERYERGLEEKLPDTFSHMRDVGRAAHLCIESYKEHLHSSGLEQDLEMVSLIVEDVMSNSREVTTTRIYDDVFWVFRSFAMQYHHNPKTYFGSEFRVERALPESDVIIEGYPDHIETMQDEHGPIIVSDDIKTGYGTSVKDDHKFQGEIMAWMMLEWFEGNRVGWRVSFPRTDFRSEITEFSPNASPRLEGRMRSIIARVDRAREEKRWPATPGSACEYCPIAAKCRERNVLVKNDIIITNEEEAAAAAQDFVIINAAYDQRRAQLKDWADEYGPITVGDVAVGFEVSAPGLRISDVGLLIMQLGIKEAIAQQYAKDEKDPKLSTDDGQRLIAALGVRAAIKDGLLSINGNKTKTKAVQDDPRLRGLWVAGDTKTSFGIYKPKKAIAK